jgi:hypothetical protein
MLQSILKKRVSASVKRTRKTRRPTKGRRSRKTTKSHKRRRPQRRRGGLGMHNTLSDSLNLQPSTTLDSKPGNEIRQINHRRHGPGISVRTCRLFPVQAASFTYATTPPSLSPCGMLGGVPNRTLYLHPTYGNIVAVNTFIPMHPQFMCSGTSTSVAWADYSKFIIRSVKLSYRGTNGSAVSGGGCMGIVTNPIVIYGDNFAGTAAINGFPYTNNRPNCLFPFNSPDCHINWRCDREQNPLSVWADKSNLDLLTDAMLLQCIQGFVYAINQTPQTRSGPPNYNGQWILESTVELYAFTGPISNTIPAPGLLPVHRSAEERLATTEPALSNHVFSPDDNRTVDPDSVYSQPPFEPPAPPRGAGHRRTTASASAHCAEPAFIHTSEDDDIIEYVRPTATPTLSPAPILQPTTSAAAPARHPSRLT